MTPLLKKVLYTEIKFWKIFPLFPSCNIEVYLLLMKYIITEQQLSTIIFEQNNVDTNAINLINKANSFFVSSFKENYSSQYESAKKHVDIDNILNEVLSYINTMSKTIWSDIKTGKSPNGFINSIIQKLNTVALDEYRDISSVKKFLLKKTAKSGFKTKEELANYLLDPPGESFGYDNYGALIRSIFNRIKNWLLNDLKGLDVATKQKINNYYGKADSYLDSVMKPTYAKLINMIATDIYS